MSTFGEEPGAVGPDHLSGLIDHALNVIPEDQVQDTPIYLMATAGMRLLPQAQQEGLVREICAYFRQNTRFSLPACSTNIQVISGETEGLYGWIASNYLLGGFDHPEDHAHGKGHHTYGFLDMGGASAQVAFAPNSTEAVTHANDLKLVRLRTMNGEPSEYRVFTASWLGFGVNRAREAYVEALLDLYELPDHHEIPDPCMPAGLRTTLSGEPVGVPATGETTLVGTGKFQECLRKTYPLLGKDAPCEDHPCMLNGQHVPAIDFDVNHFIGVSEYWHTTHGVFDEKGDKTYDLATYQHRVLDFCTQDWATIETSVDTRKTDVSAKDAQEACFKASWLINVLYDGIGIPRITIEHTHPPGTNASEGALEGAQEKGFLDPFQPVDKIDGFEVSWTLGKMLLYAAGQVPPKDDDALLPVGFGSNVGGVPGDFQYAGSTWEPLRHIGGDDDNDDDGDGWTDAADELLDKAKKKSTSSFFLFVLLLVVLAYLLRKKERRTRLYAKASALFRRSRRPGSPRGKPGRGGAGAGALAGLTSKLFGRSPAAYERVMEEGEAAQFELADADLSDEGHSDGSEASHVGRSSGLATPKHNLDMFDDGSLSGAVAAAGLGLSAMDRTGLVVRTESRERLVPTLQMLGAGRRSRAGSPTRLKSPSMLPLQED